MAHPAGRARRLSTTTGRRWLWVLPEHKIQGYVLLNDAKRLLVHAKAGLLQNSGGVNRPTRPTQPTSATPLCKLQKGLSECAAKSRGDLGYATGGEDVGIDSYLSCAPSPHFQRRQAKALGRCPGYCPKLRRQIFKALRSSISWRRVCRTSRSMPSGLTLHCISSIALCRSRDRPSKVHRRVSRRRTSQYRAEARIRSHLG